MIGQISARTSSEPGSVMEFGFNGSMADACMRSTMARVISRSLIVTFHLFLHSWRLHLRTCWLVFVWGPPSADTTAL